MSVSTEDWSAIMDLVARYNHTWDLNGPDGAAQWASTFTEDGVFEVNLHRPEGVETLIARGRAELEDAYKTRHASQGPTGGQHWNNNHVIEGDGDTASHRCYYMQVSTRSASIVWTGVYYSTVVKVNDEWHFARREVIINVPPR